MARLEDREGAATSVASACPCASPAGPETGKRNSVPIAKGNGVGVRGLGTRLRLEEAVGGGQGWPGVFQKGSGQPWGCGKDDKPVAKAAREGP